MNPKQFLVIGGIILLLVGILGFVGILGPTASDSIFGATWYFDNAENWAHAVLGIVALLLFAQFDLGHEGQGKDILGECQPLDLALSSASRNSRRL